MTNEVRNATAQGPTVQSPAKSRPAKPHGDRRVRRTRARLADALVELMRTKPVESITVTELAERADVNRVTFYAHYNNVQELLGQIEDDAVAAFRSVAEAHAKELVTGEYLPFVTATLVYIDEHDSMISVLLSSFGNTLFNDLADSIRDICNEIFDPVSAAMVEAGDEGDRIDGDVDLDHARMIRDYQFDYIFGGIMNVIRDWFRGGRKESIEFMAAIISSTTKAAGLDSLRENIRLAVR
ncbi:TetR/AcrR family transcriptional regulator [Bifidobacterium simiarum]|uniref:TetR/AcrR family transcriptional regulator n=1 Tax=Bifidobacterium simiarum TaxID=2045441 RepID=UPI001BDD8189|nr:TetR/AcrR family transcriptional regulator [Bifidobacterium simiarum]MBT1166527.1 TetR/AcrR family transcriptional regulator C-terminal domain-containing protein [Bifidobacterium simiarum]